jgi:hypothetical protein
MRDFKDESVPRDLYLDQATNRKRSFRAAMPPPQSKPSRNDYISKMPLDTDLGPFKRTHEVSSEYYFPNFSKLFQTFDIAFPSADI